MSLSSVVREALLDGDVVRIRGIWAAACPGKPQPKDLAETEVAMHQARTGAESIPLHKRLYSHAWLIERAMRSSLPVKLKPAAERVESRIVSAVGISVNSLSRRGDRIEEAAAIEHAMATAAGEAMESGITDPEIVSAIMWQARDGVVRGS